MKYHKYSQYLLILVIFLVLTYISIVFHVNHNDNNKDFASLYNGLKNIEQKENSFLKLSNSGNKAGDYLMKKLSVEKDNLLKSDVIQIIGFTGCSNCEEKLIPFLDDPNWRVRFFTIDTLDKLNYARVSALLPKIILSDLKQQVKIEAIMTLGKYGTEKDIKFLEDLATQKEYQNKNLNKAISLSLAKLRLHSRNN